MTGLALFLVAVVMYWLIKSQFKSMFSRQGKSFLHRELARKDIVIRAYKLRVAYLEQRLKHNNVDFEEVTPTESTE